ncbi:helix-loop-helix dna-binding protein [Stemphylium lycopersici]|uniref:Helix-loop-helix dna-binding protein n=1 Tax=Stemphylium lycopersici TaxID=183478 RepID=A0A364N333_STELY|nr:helix-loop-helix dna-binding protein [Stemphylium lycopersici]RAR04390.1 helix-loop-helix dna-binding protein [Stemphylium lycopersici]RAR10775.1 helix-loop-helix dna-binding protein [Stemphylium lycopersici]
MNDKDPPPFGYTFSNDFFDSAPTTYDNNGQSILSDMENQQLDNFFSSTNPFDLLDSHPLPPALDDKASAHDYNNWEDFIAPPTVHRVTSTIPDQARLQNSFHPEPQYTPSLHNNFLGNTEDELQAATTLFNHAQPSYTNGRSHSFHEQPASHSFLSNGSDLNQSSLPISMPAHGLMHERLGSLLPNNSGQGLDTQFSAPWPSKAPQHHQTDFGPPLQKMDLKRSYTFGTDNSFNSPAGYSAPNGHSGEHSAARPSISDVEETHQHLLRAVAGIEAPSASPTAYPHASTLAGASRDDDPSDESASDEELEDRPAKKRKKSQSRAGKDTPKKAVRNAKARNVSVVDEKKKRAPAATQKTHRENLTEEQKRNNHILSEQKRRDLIKQGYKDLNELVPAVRGGGLSKSQILVEAATFLEKLIEDNIAYRKAAG